MKKHILITLIAIVLLPNIADAQRWKRFRRQIIGGIGVTNFLGDLGGGPGIGRDFIWDLDVAATRPSLMIGYRYQFNSYFFGRANIQWGWLKADDKFTENEFRQERNLNFRSFYAEVDLMAEFYLIQNARGNLYRLRGVRGRRGLKMDVYFYGGLGFMYFNPTAELNGERYKLQKLGTEGQGLPGQPEKYKRTTFTIPYGIGLGKSIDRYWGVNVELTFRQTFSDYIDDVSGFYYGRQNLFDENVANGVDPVQAAIIANLSDQSLDDPRITVSDYQAGNTTGRNDLDDGSSLRGDSNDNDAFMSLMVTVSRKIVKRRRSRPKF